MITFGRNIINNSDQATQREWLVTNGLGGFASGTIAGVLTRRYHGLLVAALNPPQERTLLVSKVDDDVQYAGQRYTLYANSWAPNTFFNRGFELLDSFRLEGTTPVWSHAFGDGLLEKRIWMQQGANTTYVHYDFIRGSGPIKLTLKTLVNYRDFHGSTHGNGWEFDVQPVENGLRVAAYDEAEPYYLLCDSAEFEPQHSWYRNYHLAAEQYRGLSDREDHLLAGQLTASLAVGQSLTLTLTTDPQAQLDGVAALAMQKAHEAQLWQLAKPTYTQVSDELKQLVLAADQCVVKRQRADDADGRTVIAGYPWFGDWGRDSMIALPGLTLATGRPDVAKCILTTFAKYVDEGMLPNRFPDQGEQPEYNTADATLWYFEAIRAYFAATNDTVTVRKLYPVLVDIVAWHQRGTRYGIRQDAQDGLLFAGVDGVQLTWMDAKVDDWVVTPRIGKPVEVNALWYNALCILAEFAHLLGEDAAPYEALAAQVKEGFSRFWNPLSNSLYDVLDGRSEMDDALRPNQLFAVSLCHSPLSAEKQKQVVDVCAQQLLTPHGLRSLGPDHPAYIGRYEGGTRKRDGAYHQGTVWSWLIGPFVEAHLRVYGDKAQARGYLLPLLDNLHSHCIGSISEIFDGDAPFTPRGAVAQAWGIGELLRLLAITKPTPNK